MADQTLFPDAVVAAERPAGRTEHLVRETWRHYYCARLAEAQFGPDSIEASIAHSRALTSYRELRGSLRELDPYYRPPAHRSPATGTRIRHLKLVCDDPSESGPALDP
jgi:hypothetical protein